MLNKRKTLVLNTLYFEFFIKKLLYFGRLKYCVLMPDTRKTFRISSRTLRMPDSIDRNKVNDDELDCEDYSDECKENPISSAKEMIKDSFLKKFIWVTLTGVFIFNTLVIVKNIKKLRSIGNKHSAKYYNLIFVLNLSFSDIIFGFVLSAIAFSSKKFSGVYCSKDFEWRSSLSCNGLGILTLVSSQTSLNILVLMTGFRLYTVYKPFRILDISKTKVMCALIVCWVFPLILSLTPIVFNMEFVQEFIISSNIFLKNKIANRIIKPGKIYQLAKKIENVWTASPTEAIPPSESIYEIRDLSKWYFNSESFRNKHPNTSVDIIKMFGYYSSSAVCLPDFYSSSFVISMFNVTMMSFNLLLVIFISIGYVMIFIKTKSANFEKLS